MINLLILNSLFWFVVCGSVNSLVFVEENKLSLKVVSDEDFHIYLNEQLQCIAQQKKSKTFAVRDESSVRLLDDLII